MGREQREFAECVESLEISDEDMEDWGDYRVIIDDNDPNEPVRILWESGPIAIFGRNVGGWRLA